jgi:hypothetical protein
MAPGRIVKVPVVTVTSTPQPPTFPGVITNWESGNNTMGMISVPMQQIAQSFALTNAEYQNGFRLDTLAAANAATFAQTVMGRVTSKLHWIAGPIPSPLVYPADGTSFGGFYKGSVAASATFGANDLRGILGALPCCDRVCLWIANSLYWKIAFNANGNCCFILTPSTGPAALGLSSIQANDVWTGGDTGLAGFAFCPKALVLVTAPPVELPCEGVTSRIITLPGLNIPVRVSTWCSTATRTVWVSYDVMIGVAVGDPTAGVLIEPGVTPPAGGVVVTAVEAMSLEEKEETNPKLKKAA